MVLRKESGNTAAAFGVLYGMAVNLFALQNGHAAQVGTATVSEAGATSETEAVRIMHNHDLLRQQGKDLFVIRTVVTTD